MTAPYVNPTLKRWSEWGTIAHRLPVRPLDWNNANVQRLQLPFLAQSSRERMVMGATRITRVVDLLK